MKEAEKKSEVDSSSSSVEPAYLTINYTLKSGTVGTYYSDYVTVSGGGSSAYYTWTVSSGSLPSGLSLTSSNSYAYIRGTPTTSGTYTFTLRAYRAATGEYATKTLTISITSGSTSSLTINYTLKSGTVGTYYNDYVTVSGGGSSAYYTWSVSSGSLPPGLSLTSSNSTAYVRGTPTTAGTYTFTLRAYRSATGQSATKTLTVTIESSNNDLTISYTFENYTVGSYYSDLVRVTNLVSSAYYTWSVSNGSLPPGLSLVSSNNYAYLRGTPTTAGTYTFTLRVYRAATGQSGTKTFTISSSSSLTINSIFRDGTANTYYNDYVTVTGGSSSAYYTWSLSSGTLPPGLSLVSSNSTAYLRGTPTTAGTYTFALRAYRSATGDSTTKTFTVTISGPSPDNLTINYTFQSGKVGTYYNDYVTVANSVSSAYYTWSVSSGSLPPGLSLVSSNSSAYLRGTPTTAGTYTFTLRAYRSATNQSGTKNFTITISNINPLTINYTFSNFNIGTYYNDFVTVTGGGSSAYYTWSVSSGSLPPGLSLVSSNSYAYIRGTPTTSGTYTFTLRAYRAATGDYATKTFTMTGVGSSLTINYTFKAATVGTYYSDFVTVSGGGSSAYYTWSVISGRLPYGLSLQSSNSYAYIRGTPTISGTYAFTLRAYRAATGDSVTKTFSITVSTRNASSSSVTENPEAETVSEVEQVSQTEEKPEGSSSNSNCNSGFGTAALILMTPFILKRKS